MKKTVGLFGGSFDPIHLGHINLAVQLMEIHRLDQVIWMPAHCSPFKTATPPHASPKDRLAMLAAALEGIPQFRISTLEIDRHGPSYTIDSVRALCSENASLRLLLSEEAAAHFNQWKEASELLRLAPPLIGGRRADAHPLLPDLLKPAFTPTRILEISSTEVRERLKKKLYCGHLIPAKALDYIHLHHLYSMP